MIVFVSHVDSPHSERLVYALLDTQSEKSFMLDETDNALGVRGERVELSLSTMSAEDMPVQSDKVRGLVVRGFDSDVKVNSFRVFSEHHACKPFTHTNSTDDKKLALLAKSQR